MSTTAVTWPSFYMILRINLRATIWSGGELLGKRKIYISVWSGWTESRAWKWMNNAHKSHGFMECIPVHVIIYNQT
jgi:hypothetical protein